MICEKLATRLVWLAVLLNVVTAFIGAINLRYLMHDETAVLLHAISFRTLYESNDGLRYFQSFIRIPAALILRVAPSEAAVSSFLMATGICYWLFPLLGLGWALWLARRSGAKELFVPILLTFALAAQSGMANAGGLVADNLVFFWPALIFVFFAPEVTWWSVLALALIVLGWCFSHETSILCMGFVGAAAFLPFLRTPRRDLWPRFSAMLICLLGELWIVYIVLRPNHVDSQHFLRDLQWYKGPFFTCTGVILGAWAGFLLFGSRWPRLAKVLAGFTLAAVIYFSIRIGSATGMSLYWWTVFARTTMIPVALVIAMLAIGVKWLDRSWLGSSSASRTYALIALALVLTFSAFNDGTLDLHWIRSKDKILAMTRKSSGCSEYSDGDKEWQNLSVEGVNYALVGSLSILLQQSSAVSRIILWKNPGNRKVQRFCCAVKNGFLPFYDDGESMTSHVFDFSRLISAIDQQGLDCPAGGAL